MSASTHGGCTFSLAHRRAPVAVQVNGHEVSALLHRAEVGVRADQIRSLRWLRLACLQYGLMHERCERLERLLPVRCGELGHAVVIDAADGRGEMAMSLLLFVSGKCAAPNMKLSSKQTM